MICAALAPEEPRKAFWNQFTLNTFPPKHINALRTSPANHFSHPQEDFDVAVRAFRIWLRYLRQCRPGRDNPMALGRSVGAGQIDAFHQPVEVREDNTSGAPARSAAA